MDCEQLKKELLVPTSLAVQRQATLCAAVFTVTRSSSAFAKGSSELVISKQERELGVMVDSSCKMSVL